MALAFTVRSLDALPGPLREHYVRQKDGTWTLQTTGEHPTVTALQGQIAAMRQMAQQEAHAADLRTAAATVDKRAAERRARVARATVALAGEVGNIGGNSFAVSRAPEIYAERIQADDAGDVTVLNRHGEPSPMSLRDLAAEFAADAPAMFSQRKG
jgi:hypothetical protein